MTFLIIWNDNLNENVFIQERYMLLSQIIETMVLTKDLLINDLK